MAGVKARKATVSATLVGDVVASRDVADRAALHSALLGAIDAVNADLDAEVGVDGIDRREQSGVERRAIGDVP